MLELGKKWMQKKATEAYAFLLNLVAGAGFEPATFGL